MDTLVYVLVYPQIAAIAYNIRRNGVQAGSLNTFVYVLVYPQIAA